MTPEIYDNQQRLEWNKKKFAQSDRVSASNKEAVKRFCDKCYAEGLSKARVKKYITNFHTILTLAPDDFELEGAEKPDLERLVATIEQSDYSEATKSDFKTAIKKYYKVMQGEGRHYPAVLILV